MRKASAFTLIELLIVVAIIAILAAIAVPNFLEAQVRSKVSRAQADMRAMATALEAYRTDNSKYPPCQAWYIWHSGWPTLALRKITTPIAYMTSVPQDTFRDRHVTTDPAATGVLGDKYYRYHAEWFRDVTMALGIAPRNGPVYGVWTLVSAGPDEATSRGEFYLWGLEVLEAQPNLGDPPFSTTGSIYDPTNGTVSNGDIIRRGP